MNNQNAELVNCGMSDQPQKRCCSCGELLINRKQRYCSDECKSRFRRQLWLAEGLLYALNTRFAALRWSASVLILQVLPFGESRVYCFQFNRTASTKPAEDIGRMADEIGNIWSRVFGATGSRSRAARNVFTYAKTTVGRHEFFRLGKRKTSSSSVVSSNLQWLELTVADLLVPDCEQRIKTAFRQRAMSTHPDHGGTADEFRRTKEACDILVAWARKPHVQGRRVTSLPNARVYHGERSRNRWSPPSG